MNEIWFCYTMLFILMCLFSASMSLSAYFVSHRTTYLGIMAFFIALEIWYFTARIKTISPEQARAYGVKRLEETEGPKAV